MQDLIGLKINGTTKKFKANSKMKLHEHKKTFQFSKLVHKQHNSTNHTQIRNDK